MQCSALPRWGRVTVLAPESSPMPWVVSDTGEVKHHQHRGVRTQPLCGLRSTQANTWLKMVPSLDGVHFPPAATHASLPGTNALALAQATPAAPREGWQEPPFPAVPPLPGSTVQSWVPGLGQSAPALPISVLLSKQCLPRLQCGVGMLPGTCACWCWPQMHSLLMRTAAEHWPGCAVTSTHPSFSSQCQGN